MKKQSTVPIDHSHNSSDDTRISDSIYEFLTESDDAFRKKYCPDFSDEEWDFFVKENIID